LQLAAPILQIANLKLPAPLFKITAPSGFDGNPARDKTKMSYNQDRLDPPMDLDLYWRNRRPSNTPIIELATAGPSSASLTALGAMNLRAMRSELNSYARCRARMQYLTDLYRTAKRNETAYGQGVR